MADFPFLVKKNELVDPVRVFSCVHQGQDLYEKQGTVWCNTIGRILNGCNIKFAAFNSNWYYEILVNQEDYDRVKQLAQDRKTDFWLRDFELREKLNKTVAKQ